MFKLFIAITTATALAACSTTPITVSTGTRVPDKHVYKKEAVAQNDPTKGNITIFRDAGFLGSGCSFDISFNNEKYFSIAQNQYLTVSLEPNEYIIAASTGAGLCPNSQFTQETLLKAGDNKEYRISFNSNGQIMFTRQK